MSWHKFPRNLIRWFFDGCLLGGTFNLLFKIITVKQRLLYRKSREESSDLRCSQKLFTTEHPLPLRVHGGHHRARNWCRITFSSWPLTLMKFLSQVDLLLVRKSTSMGSAWLEQVTFSSWPLTLLKFLSQVVLFLVRKSTSTGSAWLERPALW